MYKHINICTLISHAYVYTCTYIYIYTEREMNLYKIYIYIHAHLSWRCSSKKPYILHIYISLHSLTHETVSQMYIYIYMCENVYVYIYIYKSYLCAYV